METKETRRGPEVGFVNIWAEDVGKSVAFYERLGLPKRFHIETKFGGYAEFGTQAGGAGSDAGSVRLCICGRKELGAFLGKHAGRHEGGGVKVSVMFVHDDVQAAYRRAVEGGAESVTEAGPVGCFKQMLARVLDPDGNLITLIARLSPKEQAKRLHEIAGPVALEALQHPDRAGHLSLDGLPLKPGEASRSSAAFSEFLNRIPDEQLAKAFAVGGMMGMENALMERINVM